MSETEDGPPNFFCRLPTSEKSRKMDRAASPPPLAFLQHIYDNYRQPDTESGSSSHRAGYSDSINGDASKTSSNSGLTNGRMYPDAVRKNGGAGRTELQSSTPTMTNGSAEVEAPWFSQLANLAQVRSAGVPMIALGLPSRNIPAPSRSKTKPMEPASSSSSASSSRLTDHNTSNTVMNSSSSFSSIETPSISSSIETPAPLTKGDGRSSTFKQQSTTPTSTSTAPLVPPENFAMVNSWVYRSSFPKKRHFPFLKTLGLKSVLTLILEEYPEQNTQFLDDNGITFFQFGIPGNKEPFVHIPPDKITAALLTILDRRNHPMLIHCNKGKHRTGCLIGCLRKLQQWSLTTIFDEYRRFSVPKSRSMDQEFIELYPESLVWLQVDKLWLPRWAVLAKGGKYNHRNYQIQHDEEEGIQRERDHRTAAHSTLSLTVDAVHKLKMKGM